MQQALPEISTLKSEIKSISEALLKLTGTPGRSLDSSLLANICGDLGLNVNTSCGCVCVENGERNGVAGIRLLPTSQLPNPIAIGLGTLVALKSMRPDLSMARMLIPDAKPVSAAAVAADGKNLFYGTDEGLSAGKVSVASGIVFPASLKFTLTISGMETTGLADNSIAMMARLINGLGQSLNRQNDALAPVKIAYTSINSQKTGAVFVQCTAFILQRDVQRIQKFLETYTDNFAKLYNVPCRFQVIAASSGIHTDTSFSQTLRQSVSQIHASGLTELNEYFVLPLEHPCYAPAPCALVLIGAGTNGIGADQNSADLSCLRSGIEALTWFCLSNSALKPSLD